MGSVRVSACVVSAGAVLLVVAACGGDSSQLFEEQADAGSPDGSAAGSAGASAGGTSGASGAGPVGGSGGGGGSIGPDGSAEDADPDQSSGDSGQCTGQIYAGQPVPLDIHVLLDATASMNGSSGGPIVWPAVTQALVDVLSGAGMQGVGVSLSWLPVPPPTGFKPPGTCTTSGDCPGSTGPCASLGGYNACAQSCVNDQDCGLYGPCMALMTQHFCNGVFAPGVSCDPADYVEPAVPMAVLPGNKAALVQAIQAKLAEGEATPTQPALQGALAYAQQWVSSHPGHLGRVVMITDGEPNNCTTNTIQGATKVVADHFAGSPSIATYVLGVGNAIDWKTEWEALAVAGGSDQVYVADAANVSTRTAELFQAIRARDGCSFQLPQTGSKLDYSLVNVYYTSSGQSQKTAVQRVGGAAQCDASGGGWYYDTDPQSSDPTRIILCAATCQAFQQGGAGLEFMVGCKQP